jgi:hypothetical protein
MERRDDRSALILISFDMRTPALEAAMLRLAQEEGDQIGLTTLF